MKSKLFAQNNLKYDEMQLFNRLFDIMFSSLTKPDLLVYLYADILRLQQNIKRRGREFEQNISNLYLKNIQEKYLDYLRKQDDFPVLILEVTKVDFVTDKAIYESIKESMLVRYERGLHYKTL
jgi:deoxyadenosine/deoxycytidine kinase